MLVTPNVFKRRPDHYCSPACGREGQRKKLAQANQRPSTHWRASALREYGRRCSVCGFDVVVEVHHITPRSRGGSNDLTNLIPLCPNHHAMAHAGLVTEAELLAFRAALST